MALSWGKASEGHPAGEMPLRSLVCHVAAHTLSSQGHLGLDPEAPEGLALPFQPKPTLPPPLRPGASCFFAALSNGHVAGS